jgi:deglycase
VPRLGGSVTAVGLDDVEPADVDAVVVVGGGGARLLFDDAALQELLRTAHDQGKVVAAICLAPVVLARAGLLAGRRATVAGTMSGEIEQHGATYTGPRVTVDGTVVTANAPKASRAFGEVIAELLR